jgi:lactoylglutathione lyase
MDLHHTMIRVNDLDQTLRFYQGFLGLKEKRRHDVGDEATLVFLTDDAESHLIELTWNKDGRGYTLGDQFGHLAFLTDDLDAVKAKARAEGRWFRESRPELKSRYIFVKDPNGYDIEILQRR